MIQHWLVEEVQHLVSLWYRDSLSTKKPNAYPLVLWYLDGDYDLDECILRMQAADRRLAKKQRTWFRRYMRDSEKKPVDGVVYCNYWVE
jgi:tRNA dimethylallyltransferase